MATTPFEELQAQAETWCQEFEQYKEECKVFAERMRIDWIEYLGAKSTDVEFHKLDEHLDRIADGAFTLSPRLQVGDDGFVYFGLTLFLKMDKQCVDEHVRVGVQRVKGHWRVRWNHLEIAYGASGSHDGFFQKATATIAQKFTTPFHRRRGPLGFVPIVSNEHLTLVAPADVRAAEQQAVGQAADGAAASAPAAAGAVVKK